MWRWVLAGESRKVSTIQYNLTKLNSAVIVRQKKKKLLRTYTRTILVRWLVLVLL